MQPPGVHAEPAVQATQARLRHAADVQAIIRPAQQGLEIGGGRREHEQAAGPGRALQQARRHLAAEAGGLDHRGLVRREAARPQGQHGAAGPFEVPGAQQAFRRPQVGVRLGQGPKRLGLAQGQDGAVGAQQPGQQGRAHVADVEDEVAALGQAGLRHRRLSPRQRDPFRPALGRQHAGVQEAGAIELVPAQPDEGHGFAHEVQAVRENLRRGLEGG